MRKQAAKVEDAVLEPGLAEGLARELRNRADEADALEPENFVKTINIENDGNAVTFTLPNGDRLGETTLGGTRIERYGNDSFEGLFKELSSSTKEVFVRRLIEQGMDKKDAKKAVELISEKATKAMFPDLKPLEKRLKDKAVQQEIEQEFASLSGLVKQREKARETAKYYSDSPSDDGSFNLESAAIGAALSDKVAYLNKLRDYLSHYDIAIEYGDKVPLNKQTQKWISSTFYSGAIGKAVNENRKLFID